MIDELVAIATAKINAPLSKVWEALINPELIKQYMFGTSVTSDFKEGSSIVWKGEWNGKAYEDKGTITAAVKEKMLQYTHFSTMEGVEDTPENYRTVITELFQEPGGVHVTITQDNNPTEQAREESEKNWQTMLDSMKKLLEQKYPK